MKQITLFFALLCATVLSYAGMATSEYCGYAGDETKWGDAYVTLTWETLANGDVQITLSCGTNASSCSFRNGGFEGGIDAFVVSTDNFATSEAASKYFTAEKVYSGNTFTLVKTADLPTGAQIKHVGTGHALAWKVNGKDAYTFPDLVYSYGTACDESVLTKINVTAASGFAKVGEGIALTATALDQYGKVMKADIAFAVSPSDAGSINDAVFTPAKLGAITITASSGAVSGSLTLYGVSSDNLAEGKTVEAGYNPGNVAEQASAAVDGKDNTYWVTWANQPAEKEWIYVDLGAKYDLTGIDVLWGADYSTEYILQVRVDAPEEADKADDLKWETVATVKDAAANSDKFSAFAEEGRYVRLHSLTKSNVQCIRLAELRVFGTEWAPKDDKEKPVMVKAELVSKSSSEIVIKVEATDNDRVKRYHITDKTNALDVTLTDKEGEVTISGLKADTEYNLIVTAIDAAGNESENNKSVAAKTNKIGSEYCAKVMSSGNTEAAFVWETDENGAVVITILETLGGPDEATHFRRKGISIEKFKVGESKENADTYFEHACEGNTVVLSLKDPSNAPEVGTKIYVTNQIIEYATSKDNNAWPSLTFEYSYGRVCTGDPVLTRLNLSADAYFCKIGDTIHLSAAAVDQLGKPMDVEIVYEMDPKDAGAIEKGIYIPAIEGATTITAKAGELTASIIVSCAMGGNTAEGKDAEAGYNPENQAELAGSANDGDENTAWVTWENRPAEEEWWYVDLGAKYNLAGIEVLWGVDYSKEYILQAREEAPAEADKANDDAWVLLDTVRNAKADAATLTVVNAPARYVRLHSLARSSAQCIRVREIRVFAYDKEKPVLVNAELVSKTWNSAVISVSATDNFGIKGFRVVETTLALDSIYQPVDGKITINNLQPETEYTFAITAIDNAQYESDAKNVAVKTDEEPKDEGLENVQGDNVQCTKVIENGVLYLMYKGTKYNVQGQEVR